MKAAIKCAMLSIAVSFPIALLMAFSFRFPIPLGGYIGPASEIGINYTEIIDLVKMVTVAWLFYGVLGGFIFLAIGGASASIFVTYIVYKKEDHQDCKVLFPAILVAFFGCGFLAILDYIIGPW